MSEVMQAMDQSWVTTSAVTLGLILVALGFGVMLVSLLEWLGNRRWMQ